MVFGNSGAGKTTYAKAQAAKLQCAHMDLDTVAWTAGAESPTRRPIQKSSAEICSFIESHESWVVEGCYANLLEIAIAQASEVVFLNPGVDVCIENARKRPWEPHKYDSKAAQDANLGMLIEWIKQYDSRNDEFSLAAHRRLFDGFSGAKQEHLSNAH